MVSLPPLLLLLNPSSWQSPGLAHTVTDAPPRRGPITGSTSQGHCSHPHPQPMPATPCPPHPAPAPWPSCSSLLRAGRFSSLRLCVSTSLPVTLCLSPSPAAWPSHLGLCPTPSARSSQTPPHTCAHTHAGTDVSAFPPPFPAMLSDFGASCRGGASRARPLTAPHWSVVQSRALKTLSKCQRHPPGPALRGEAVRANAINSVWASLPWTWPEGLDKSG